MILRSQVPLHLCLILIIILMRKLRNCKLYWFQNLVEAIRTMGFVTYRENKGDLKDHTQWIVNVVEAEAAEGRAKSWMTTV